MADERDCVSRDEFNKERDRINNRLTEHDKSISALDQLCKNLVDLPKTIANLDKTMGIMGANLQSLNEQIKDLALDKDEKDKAQNAKISELDNKSKVDFLSWVKSNWTSVVMFVVLLILLVGQFVPLK